MLHTYRFCFNEAATFRSRKRSRRAGFNRPSPRFNEAATFRSRKPGWLSCSTPTGFCFNEAATFRSRKHEQRLEPYGGHGASMRPRPFDRGNLNAIALFEEYQGLQ